VSAWSGSSARINIILLYRRVFSARLAHQGALTATISEAALAPTHGCREAVDGAVSRV
jgi:hypothetical protein